MSPRRYTMGKRAVAVEETRRRILDAALAEYAATGISDASMQSIARRADVAAGTVLYHFPDPDDLADAVLAASVERMAVPDPEMVSAAGELPDRIRVMTSELFRVYAHTTSEYLAWTKSQGHPAMARVEGWYNDRYAALLVAALGASSRDSRALQVVSALVEPGFRANLVQRGLTDEQAVEETVRLVCAWLADRSA